MRRFWVRCFEILLLPWLRMPLRFHYAIGSGIAWFAEKVMKYRRDVVLVNLSRSFPELKYKELDKLLHETYVHFGELIAETLWFAGCTGKPERLRKQHICEITNNDLMDDLYRNTPSVMALNSHFGNWELMGGMLEYDYRNVPDKALDKDKIVVIHKELKSAFWNQILEDSRLAAVGHDFKGYIETNNAMRYVARNRNNKRVYIFPTDQHPYRKSGRCDVTFMGQHTTTMYGGAALACKLKMSVVYVAADRVERGHYRMTYTKICDDASLTTPEEIMNKYYELLEADVRRNPMNYLWTHKRWK